MKDSLLTLILFPVLLAISEVRSEESMKLYGLEFIEADVYICASSRWRRHPEGIPQSQQGNINSRESFIFIFSPGSF